MCLFTKIYLNKTSKMLYNELLATVRLCFHAEKAALCYTGAIIHRRKNRTKVRTGGNLLSANRARGPGGMTLPH